jgi:hypothetical protein
MVSIILNILVQSNLEGASITDLIRLRAMLSRVHSSPWWNGNMLISSLWNGAFDSQSSILLSILSIRLIEFLISSDLLVERELLDNTFHEMKTLGDGMKMLA